ncbi:hypothetical protein BGZ73_007171 [Actinomortierella ambigua]|nr:hypothetical protein BGZ73_007171 [Actinomortierella ambigua]
MAAAPSVGGIATPPPLYADDSSAYFQLDPSGIKQPHDRMRLHRILNDGARKLQQQQHHPFSQVHPPQPTPPSETDHYQHYPYQDSQQQQQLQPQPSSASPLVSSSSSSATSSSLPMTPCSPIAVPVTSPLPPMSGMNSGGVSPAIPTTLATMSSPMSPLTSFSTMSQPSLIFDTTEVMPYSYNLPQYQHHSYPFKHAGNARPMDQPSFVPDSSQGQSAAAHYYHSPDPSGSPSAINSFPPRTVNSLVDHQYPTPDSPPPFHGQYQAPSPYSVGSHSPISNGYTSAYVAPGTPGSGSLTPTPPTTPHYGFSHPADVRYAPAPMPVYADHITLQSQVPGRPQQRYMGGPSTPPTPTSSISASSAAGTRARKTPYERSRNQDGTPVPRRFACTEPGCEKAFPTKGELASHARCHLKVPAFLCGICGRPFKRRTDYVRHVRNVHEEVGRYECRQCGVRFGRLDKLKRHDKRGCEADKEDNDK